MRKLMVAFVIAMTPTFGYAGSCADYPLTEGINVEDVNGGTKIVATSAASVSFDDIDSVRDAKDEATMLAKAQIAKFLNEDIQSDESVNKVVNESKTTTNAGKTATREEMITRIKSLRNSARALLRGVVILGDCYTKGTEVRVTVGIKPETITSAGNLDRNIHQSIQDSRSGAAQGRSTTSSSTSQGATSSGLQGVEGHSNSSRLNNF